MQPAGARRRVDRVVLLVTFSGIDGAGKSTLIDRLRTSLQEAGIRVLPLAFWQDVAALQSLREFASHALFGGDKGIGTPERPVNRRDKNVRSPAMTAIRFVVYLLDVAKLRAMVASTRAIQAEVVLFDRYLYDEVVNLPLAGRFSRAYARLLLNLTPQPDIACLVDADPALARRRKPEYPLEFLRRNRESYQALSELMGGMKVIRSVAEGEREVRQALLTKLRPAGPRSRA